MSAARRLRRRSARNNPGLVEVRMATPFVPPPRRTFCHLKVVRVGEPEYASDGTVNVVCHVDPPGDAALLDGVDRVDVWVDGGVWSCDLWVNGFDAITGAVGLELVSEAPPVGAELVAFVRHEETPW